MNPLISGEPNETDFRSQDFIERDQEQYLSTQRIQTILGIFVVFTLMILIELLGG